MKFEKPDGVIEFASSGCCCPPWPKRRTGQHTNSGTRWFRVFDGPWMPLLRWSDFNTLAEAARTCAEFCEAITEPVDFNRASGDCVCSTCNQKYYDHPRDVRMPGFDGSFLLRRLCDGRSVKL